MAGFTDATFRRIVRDLGGCGLIFTEMTGAGTWMQPQRGRPRERPERIEGIEAEARPLGVQLWDREADMIREAARRLVDLRVSVIDTGSNQVVATVPVGKRPWNMSITPDGKKLYVANGRSNSVSVIDTQSNQKVKDIAVGELPWGVLVH